jgi:predicted RecB family nuclease
MSRSGVKGTLRTCKKGHTYYKSSDCPTCPKCEKGKRPKDGFLSLLAAPARRALENNGIQTVKDLSGYSEEEILELHGMGKSSIPKLRKVLAEHQLKFRK